MSLTTKRAMGQALKELLREKPLDKVTIADITDKCGISRMTFYYHFGDIYELVEWICQEDAQRALNGKKTYETWQEGFLQIFRQVQEDKTFVLNVYRSVSREYMEAYLYRMTYELLIDVVEEKSAGKCITAEDKKFIADFYKYGFVGLMLDWIRGGMAEPPEKLVGRLSLILRGSFADAIDALGNAESSLQSAPDD